MAAPDVRELECFLVLADELHFGRTARRLYLSQARVSQLLRSLESKIGTRLLERSSRRVRLTPAGARFAAELEPAYAALLAAVDRARAAARGVEGVLRAGFVGTPNEAVMGTVRAFRERYPECEVEIVEMTLADPVGPLRGGAVDVLFICLPVDEPGLTVGPIVMKEARALAVPVDDPFARLDSVTAEQLADRTVIDIAGRPPPAWRDFLVPPRTPGGRAVRRGAAAHTLQEALSLIAAGKGVMPFPALIEDYHARRDIAFVPIHGLPDASLALVWRTNGENARVRAFAQTAR